MWHFIARLTMARSPEGARVSSILRAGSGRAAEEEEQTPTVPIFIHPKALTFPVLIALVKGAWAGAMLLPLPWAASIWFPLVACMILGLLIAISNLLEQKVGTLTWIFGLVIGLVNSLVVFAAVVAIPGGKN
jgi:hypothetical protein